MAGGMTCDACDYAQQNPRSFFHISGCPDCEARALAGSPWFAERNKDPACTQRYLDALRKLGIADSAKAAHAIVEQWAAKLTAPRTPKEETPCDAP